MAIVLCTADAGELPDALASLEDTASGSARRCSWSRPRTAPPPSRSSRSRPSSATDNAEPGRATCATRLRADSPDGVTAEVTGPAAVDADLAAVFDGADTRLLLATASVVALLLVLTYRSPVLWLIPLTVVGVADRLAAVVATQVMALTGRRLGRVDDRHPVGARLRRRHRLRAAADLALPRRAADPPSRGTRRWPSPLRRTAEAVLSQRDHRRPRPAHPAALAGARRPADSAWPARSASWSPRPSCWWCCRPRWCSSGAGSSGRRCRTYGDPAAGRHPARCGTGSATGSRARPAAFVAGTLVLLAVLAHRPVRDRDSGSTRPTSSSTSPRRSRPPSGSPSRSRPAPSSPTQVLTRDDADAGAARPSRRPTACPPRRITQRATAITADRRGARRPTPGTDAAEDTVLGAARRPRAVRRHPRRRHRGRGDRRARGRRSATGW